MTQLGPYRLRTELAVGGMAEVFLADHIAPADVRREVVVKRVLPQFADDPDHRNMFLDEARLMAALTHPYIAQVYDVGVARGTVYLVMEYIRGPTVRDLLIGAADRGRAGLPRAVALTIALAVAEALDYAHARKDPEGRPLGIVHRDLNPQNVLVAYTGGVKLIDFGIAKAASRLHQTRSGIVKGTWGYIAPEQISRTAPLDHRADIFALGVLLYELCFGRHPFGEGDHETEQLGRMVNGNAIAPETHDPAYPPALSRLLRACLRPDPADRPPRMRDVVDAIAAHVRATGESATLGELAEVVDHFVPDPQGPRAGLAAPGAPGARPPRDPAARPALAPHEMTAPSISLTLDEEETAPTRLKRLGLDAPPAAPPGALPASPAAHAAASPAAFAAASPAAFAAASPAALPTALPGSDPAHRPAPPDGHRLTRALVDLPRPSPADARPPAPTARASNPRPADPPRLAPAADPRPLAPDPRAPGSNPRAATPHAAAPHADPRAAAPHADPRAADPRAAAPHAAIPHAAAPHADPRAAGSNPRAANPHAAGSNPRAAAPHAPTLRAVAPPADPRSAGSNPRAAAPHASAPPRAPSPPLTPADPEAIKATTALPVIRPGAPPPPLTRPGPITQPNLEIPPPLAPAPDHRWLLTALTIIVLALTGALIALLVLR